MKVEPHPIYIGLGKMKHSELTVTNLLFPKINIQIDENNFERNVFGTVEKICDHTCFVLWFFLAMFMLGYAG